MSGRNNQQGTPLWLHRLGFRFDPFRHLESSDDARLGAYLVAHDLAQLAWDGPPALLFAPAGGGKTALRMHAAHACWLGQGYGQAFPLPYLPQHAEAPDEGAHMAGIAQGGATALLSALAHFPRRLLELGAPEREAVATLLDAALPAPLSYYLAQLRAGEGPAELARRLEKSYRLPAPEPTAPVAELCAALEAALPAQAPALSPRDSFELLWQIVREALGFRSLVIQMDNLDSVAETIGDPAAMAARMAWPLQQAPGWAERGIILKAFLPSELEASLDRQYPELRDGVRRARIAWTDELLSAVIRLRLERATGGRFSSLDAVSSLGLSGVEARIVATALPLPREVILLTGRVLAAYAARVGDAAGQIQPGDLQAAEEWYALHRVDPGPFTRV